MANKSKVQSVEPDIADLVNGWLKSYGLDYKLEQASLNSEIDKALDEYHSKSGGKGGNRPDTKLLLKDKYGTFYPVLIEKKSVKKKSISVLLNLTMTSTKKKQDWEKTIEYILLQLLSLQRLVQRALNLLKNLIWDLLPKAVKLTEIKSSEKLHLS